LHTNARIDVWIALNNPVPLVFLHIRHKYNQENLLYMLKISYANRRYRYSLAAMRTEQ
jgi:hypothetical protein